MKMKITKPALAKIIAPANGRLTIHDTDTPGFCVRITSKNTRTFYACRWSGHAGQMLWVKIGGVDEWTLDQARNKAREENGRIAAGENPNTHKRVAREAGTLQDMWETYRLAVTKGRRTMEEDEGLWRRYIEPWGGGRRLKEVTEESVQKLYNRVAAGKVDRTATNASGRSSTIRGGLAAANRAMALLSGMFSTCARNFAMPGYNPVRGIRKQKETACERYLSAAEMPAFWAALGKQSQIMQDVVKMALYTAQRRTPLFTMRWEEVNLAFFVWTIPAGKMKGGKAHTVPLVPEAVEILERRKSAEKADKEWVFGTASASGCIQEPKKGMKALSTAAGITPVTLHDLRRTTATWMNSTGASESTIAAILAHRYRNVTGIYAKATADTMRIALTNAVNALVAAATTAPEKVETA